MFTVPCRAVQHQRRRSVPTLHCWQVWCHARHVGLVLYGAVHRWPIQPVCCQLVHALPRRLVRFRGVIDGGDVLWSMLAWIRVSRGLDVVHCPALPGGAIRPCRIWRLFALSRRLLRDHHWPDDIHVLFTMPSGLLMSSRNGQSSRLPRWQVCCRRVLQLHGLSRGQVRPEPWRDIDVCLRVLGWQVWRCGTDHQPVLRAMRPWSVWFNWRNDLAVFRALQRGLVLCCRLHIPVCGHLRGWSVQPTRCLIMHPVPCRDLRFYSWSTLGHMHWPLFPGLLLSIGICFCHRVHLPTRPV